MKLSPNNNLFKVAVMIWLLSLVPRALALAAPPTLGVSPASHLVTLELTIPAGQLTASQIQTLLSGRSAPLSQVLPTSISRFVHLTGGSFAAQWAIFIGQNIDNGIPPSKGVILTIVNSLASSTGMYAIDGSVITLDNIPLTVTGLTNSTFPGTVTLNQQIVIPKVVQAALLQRLLQLRTRDPAVQFGPDGSLQIRKSFLLQYSRTFVLQMTTTNYAVTFGTRPSNTTTTNIGPATINMTVGNRSRGSIHFAYLDRVAVEPDTMKNLTPGVDIFLPLRWLAYIKGAGGGQLVVNASQLVVKTEGGKVLLTRPGFTLSRGVSRGITIESSTREYRETVNLPASVTRQAQLLGSRNLIFERRLSGGGRSLLATLRLPLLTVLSGPLRITREELFFDHNGRQGAYQLVVRKNADLQAIAVINFGGTGQLRGFWEISGPLTSRNEAAIFRPMPMDIRGQGGSLVLRLLSGYPQTQEKSGKLPSEQSGYYRLRFRISTPVPSFRAPQISYYVTTRTVAQRSLVPELEALRSVELIWPAAGAQLDPVNPRMAWRAVDFSGHYRVEIFSREDVRSPKIAGVVSARGQTTIALNPVTMSHLEGGKTYYWRVVGINQDGVVVATSSLRSVQVQ